jgi:glucose dehydrogenase
LSYWSDGKGDERIIYVTTGYRLVSLDARTGARISSFGKDGGVDLKTGVVYGSGQQIDLETGDIGLHATPAGDVVIVGAAHKEMTVKTHNNAKGLCGHSMSERALSGRQHDPAARRVCTTPGSTTRATNGNTGV